jgi:4-amino-4-deoxy-L-arabinose transferase-like glycosyltransferase
VGACALLVLNIQFLSLLHRIALLPLLLAVAISGLALRLLFRAPSLPEWPDRWKMRELWHPLVLPFTIVLPVLALMLLILGLHFAPNNVDSMTYHLTRAAYWRQWQTLAHYPTNNARQNAFAGNAEILVLVTLLPVHSAALAFLVQFAAYGAASLAVYALGRQIGLPIAYAVVSSGLFASMPEVVLQATTEQNDLTMAAFLLCAVYFFASALRDRRAASVLFAALALGLAIGTKPTGVLALPGIALGAAGLLYELKKRKIVWPHRWTVLAASLLLMGLLSAPWYLANLRDYGTPGGPRGLVSVQLVYPPSLHTFMVNLIRHLTGFLDPAGPLVVLPTTRGAACRIATDVHIWIARTTGSGHLLPALEFPGSSYRPGAVCTFFEDTTWFGLAGPCVVVGALAFLLAGLWVRRVDFAWLLAAGTLAYLVDAALLLRWQPWENRLLIAMMGLGAPLLGVVAQRLYQSVYARPLLFLLLLYAALTGLSAAVDNHAKPFSAWQAPAVTRLVLTRPSMGPVLAAVNRIVPQDTTMGVFLAGDDWEFPLFGAHLDRTLQPLVLPASGQRFPGGTRSFQYLITHRSAAALTSLFQALRPAHCSLQKQIDGTFSPPDPYRLYRCSAQ